MSGQKQSLRWNEQRPLTDLIADAQRERVDYLIVQAQPNPVITAANVAMTSATDLIVYREAHGTQQWSRLSHVLPASIYLLAVLPSDHVALAISVHAITENESLIGESRSLNELVVRLSSAATSSFVDNVQNDSTPTFQYPGLTLAEGDWRNPWLRDLIERIPGVHQDSSSTTLAALKAGLFLVNDFFNDSHSCSQSIEGLGSHHTGDYWHAILHRREPDAGNAKYWFRHVGRHPAYTALTQTVNRRLNEAEGSLATKLQRWKTKLITQGSWDPFSFVDLCTAAAGDAELRAWCEQVQYDEMLLLLESSARDAFLRDKES